MTRSTEIIRTLSLMGLAGTLAIGAPLVVAAETQTEPAAPTFSLPAPTGPNAVGVTTWHWIDSDRPDTYTEDPDDKREIMVHAWYPANTSPGAEPAPYRPLARNDHDAIKKHSIAGARFADLGAPAPIILLCPGRGVLAEYNTALAEDLASHGFAVFAVDSPYLAPAFFPDGSSKSTLPAFRPSSELMAGPYEEVDAFFEEAVELGAQDQYFALARIAELNAADPAGRFTGRLDLSRIGIYGHSLGGRVCGEVAATKPAVKAFAAMEAVPPRTRRRAGFDASVLMMYSGDLPEDMALPNMEEVIPNRRSDVIFAKFLGLGHNSSTDLTLLGAYQYDVDPAEGMRLMRLTLRQFFAASLNGSTFPSSELKQEDRLKFRIFRK